MGLLVLGVLALGAVRLLHSGVYGLTVASWVGGPASGGQAASYGALTVMVAVCSLLALGLEGLVCIAMSLPPAMTDAIVHREIG